MDEANQQRIEDQEAEHARDAGRLIEMQGMTVLEQGPGKNLTALLPDGRVFWRTGTTEMYIPPEMFDSKLKALVAAAQSKSTETT